MPKGTRGAPKSHAHGATQSQNSDNANPVEDWHRHAAQLVAVRRVLAKCTAEAQHIMARMPSCTLGTGTVYFGANSHGPELTFHRPKDEPIQGIGHRHDWESIVVWLSDQSTSASLLGLAVSAHGGYDTSTSPSLSGASPLVQYISYFPLDHQLDFTPTQGGQQPLIAWESLPSIAQQALANTDFGDANVPFIDANFLNNLAEASL